MKNSDDKGGARKRRGGGGVKIVENNLIKIQKDKIDGLYLLLLLLILLILLIAIIAIVTYVSPSFWSNLFDWLLKQYVRMSLQ